MNGYGKGVGDFALNGVTDYCLTRKFKINDFFTLMPFPQKSLLGIDLDGLYKENGNIKSIKVTLPNKRK